MLLRRRVILPDSMNCRASSSNLERNKMHIGTWHQFKAIVQHMGRMDSTLGPEVQRVRTAADVTTQLSGTFSFVNPENSSEIPLPEQTPGVGLYFRLLFASRSGDGGVATICCRAPVVASCAFCSIRRFKVKKGAVVPAACSIVGLAACTQESTCHWQSAPTQPVVCLGS